MRVELPHPTGGSMKRNRNLTLSANPWLAWTHLALSATQLAVISSEVIGLRLNRMLLAGPLPGLRDQAELALMSSEKAAAATRSAQAMAGGLFTLQQQMLTLAYRQMLAGVPLFLSCLAALTPAQVVARQAGMAAATVAASASAGSKAF